MRLSVTTGLTGERRVENTVKKRNHKIKAQHDCAGEDVSFTTTVTRPLIMSVMTASEMSWDQPGAPACMAPLNLTWVYCFSHKLLILKDALIDACDDGEVHLPCEDEFWSGVVCDRHENEIIHVTHLPSASDCQSLCQNHDECSFFSHNSHHEGDCWLHTQSDVLDDKDCHEDTCVAGPKYPDMDDCSQPEFQILEIFQNFLQMLNYI